MVNNYMSQVFKALPAPSVVLLTDVPRFTIAEVNDAYLELVRSTRDELVGKGFYEAFPNNPYNRMPPWNNLLEKLVADGMPNQSPVSKYLLPLEWEGERHEKYLITTNTPVRNEANEIEYILRSVTDVTEMTLARQTHQPYTSDKFLGETLRIARVGSWEADLINEIISWSDMVKEIHEVPADFQPDFLTAADFYADGPYRDEFMGAIQETIVSGKLFDLELLIVTAKGNEKWIRITGKAELNEGICTRIYGAIQDIHDRKTVEQELLKSHRQFESLVQTVDGIVWEADALTFQFNFVSDQVRNILGYTPEEFLGEPSFWQNHIHPDDRDQAVLFCHRETQGMRNHTFDYRMFKADGSLVWIKDVVSVIRENSGAILLRGLMVDITETKRLEDLEHLEKIVLEMNSGKDVPLRDVLDTYLKGIEQTFPHSKCSLLAIRNKRLTTLASPSLPPEYVKSIENLEIGENAGSCGTAAYLGERVIVSDIANDPRWSKYKHLALPHNLRACWSNPIILDEQVVATFAVYYEHVSVPGEDELKVIDRVASILKVVLENRGNSELVQESALLMAQGQELARFGNWQWDIENNVVTWSDNLYHIYGLDKSYFEPSYENYMELVHPADRQRIGDGIRFAMETRRDIEFEERIIHSSGEERFLKTWGNVKTDENGKVVRMIGACLDITNSKRIQAELAASEARLRSLVDAQTNYVIRTDVSGKFTYYNNKFEADFGWFYGDRNFIGRNCLFSVRPYHRRRVIETVEQCISKPGVVFPVELDHVDPQDDQKAAYWHFIALASENGGILEVQCIGVDISDRKKAMDALGRSNERYEFVNMATNDAIYDCDLIRDRIEWGDGFYRLFGEEAAKDPYPRARWAERVHPSERECVEAGLKALLADADKQKWSTEYRFRKANGHYAYVEEIGYVRRNRFGKAVRMIGVLRDVTKMRQERHELKLLESVITNTNDAVLIAESDPVDVSGLKILYVNAAFSRITGYTSGEVVGKSPATLRGFSPARNDFERLQDAIRNLEPLKGATIRYARDDEEFFINLSLLPVADARGVLTHWIAIGHDVTDRLRYIGEIEERNHKLQEIAWMQSHVIRAPLARLMGLIDLIRNYQNSEVEKGELLDHVLTSAYALDEIIRDISSKTEQI
nr:PAS domain-containing protein [uncultured Dyadobacter sp.]